MLFGAELGLTFGLRFELARCEVFPTLAAVIQNRAAVIAAATDPIRAGQRFQELLSFSYSLRVSTTFTLAHPSMWKQIISTNLELRQRTTSMASIL